MKEQKWHDALKDCDKSIELNDKYVKSYVKRADVYMSLKEFDKAQFDYHKIKELDPSMNVDHLLNKA
jgi:DnaJ family protein C protein 7